jgi:hypothetical protein
MIGVAEVCARLVKPVAARRAVTVGFLPTPNYSKALG